MKKNSHILKKIISLILAAVLITACFSVSAFAATAKKKQLKSVKQYGSDGKLLQTDTYTFNKNGYYISSKTKYSVDGSTTTAKCKWTFKKGLPTKAVYTDSDDEVLTVKFSKGKVTTESMNAGSGSRDTKRTYYKSGQLKKISTEGPIWHEDETFNKKGFAVNRIFIDYFGDTVKYKITNTVKKGVLRKMVVKGNDSSTETSTYDSKGNITKKVSKNSDGTKTTDTYKNKYKGGYLVQVRHYRNGKYDGKTVYTYTSKKYPVKNIKRSDLVMKGIFETYITYPAS